MKNASFTALRDFRSAGATELPNITKHKSDTNLPTLPSVGSTKFLIYALAFLTIEGNLYLFFVYQLKATTRHLGRLS